VIEDGEGTIVQPKTAKTQRRPKNTTCTVYAVARGRKTGIFHFWNEVIRSVHGYSGAVHRRFRSTEAARAWLAQKRVPGFVDDDSESGNTWATVREDVPTEIGSMEVKEASLSRTSLPLDQIVDLTTIGPDSSAGKPNEIYGRSIQVEPEVLKLLCPKGVTASVRKEIMEAAIDVVSLPGKFTSSKIGETPTIDGGHIMDQFVEAVGNMTDTNARRGGSLLRDTQWQLPTRNALDKIKTVDDLNSAAEELSGQSDNVTNNMDSAFKEILYNAGWSPSDSDSFCMTGLLPRLIRSSLLSFLEMHMHFQKLAIKHNTQWDEVGWEYVYHHARALSRIRRLALTRNQMILQVYIYLRDQKSKGFLDISLLGAMTLKWHGMALRRLPPGGGVPTPQWSCAHCHSSLHKGGARKCPFGEFKAKPARRLALETQRLSASEPGVMERLIAEEQGRQEVEEDP
jgi:hypothetical protein